MNLPTKSVLATVVLLASLSLFAGCNILAPVFFIVAGPDTYEAEYKLDDNRPTVVFIDDPRSQLPRRALRLEVLNSVQDELLRKSLLDDLIDGQAAIRVADGDSSGGQMSVTELGRTLGAEVVIWVTIDEFIRPGRAGGVQPKVAVRVRVIDAEANQLLYPAAATGRVVRVTNDVRRGAVANASGARSAAELAIATKIGAATAQLFYEYPVTDRVADRGP